MLDGELVGLLRECDEIAERIMLDHAGGLGAATAATLARRVQCVRSLLLDACAPPGPPHAPRVPRALPAAPGRPASGRLLRLVA
jgi:hypothetical protein